MWLAFVTAFFALHAEIRRRKLQIDSQTIIVYAAIAGIVGAKLWHIVDAQDARCSFGRLFSGKGFYWLRSGFACLGGFVAGITPLLLLARKYRISMLTMLDICSPGTAVGYAVGRIGCLISGD